MMLMGDEMGRTQHGNNNAYCIDDEATWVDWSLRDEYADLLALTRRLLALRRDHPAFRQRHFFAGRQVSSDGRKDIAWLFVDGSEMTDERWHDDGLRTLGLFLSGDGVQARGPHGERIIDDSYLLWLHAGADPVDVTPPGPPWAGRYERILLTAEPDAEPVRHPADTPTTLPGRSCALLRALP